MEWPKFCRCYISRIGWLVIRGHKTMINRFERYLHHIILVYLKDINYTHFTCLETFFMADHLNAPDITYKGVKDYRFITSWMRLGFIDYQRTQVLLILIMKEPACWAIKQAFSSNSNILLLKYLNTFIAISNKLHFIFYGYLI